MCEFSFCRYSIIIISNSCDTPPKENSGMLATTKSDREFHGFGLKSVKKTLKKYEGDFEWDYDEINRIFTITVMVGDPIKNNAIVQH